VIGPGGRVGERPPDIDRFALPGLRPGGIFARVASDPENSPVGRGFGAGYAIVGAGFQFAFAIVLFLGGGFLVDRWLGTRPVFTLLGLAVGLAAGFYAFLLRVMAESRR
jgi:F0F1-type ATP synthase assembly protein I